MAKNRILINCEVHLNDMVGDTLDKIGYDRFGNEKRADHLAKHFFLGAINGGKFTDAMPRERKQLMSALAKKLRKGGTEVEITDKESTFLREATDHLPPWLFEQLNEILDGDGETEPQAEAAPAPAAA